MPTYTENELDDLTEAERAALADEGDENQETTAQGDDDADETAAAAGADTKAQAQPDDAAGADAATDAGADAGKSGADGAGAEGAAADQQAAKAQPEKVTVAPVLVAEAPADVEAKLAEIGTKKDALEAKFDEGDLTRAEYRKQMDALNKDERAIEQAQLKAQLAVEMNEQAMQTAWINTAQSFAKTNGYLDNPRLFRMFDLEVQEVATSGKHANWSDILETAHANMVEAGLAPNKAAKPTAKEVPAKPAQQKVEHAPQPPNLASVPAAAHSDTSGGKYAALDRLAAGNDPDAFEDALMKMSEAERDAYRRAAA